MQKDNRDKKKYRAEKGKRSRLYSQIKETLCFSLVNVTDGYKKYTVLFDFFHFGALSLPRSDSHPPPSPPASLFSPFDLLKYFSY